MQPNIPRAAILVWRCQHGGEREGYLRPIGACSADHDDPCEWKADKK